jgi:FkbM family methyltransferase
MMHAMTAKERLFELGQQHVFGRQRFQGLFHRLHQLALVGLNYNLDDPTLNGEYALLDRLTAGWPDRPVVFDAGGFRGEWSAAVLERAPRARVFTFEPNSDSFDRIQARLRGRASVQPFALGAEDSSGSLSAPPGLPQMGSLHLRVPQQVDLMAEEIERVTIRSIDSFCAEQEIHHVDLLKLDVEGHELAALQGARGMLEQRAIGAVQFEFGGTAIDAGVYLRDLLQVLTGYDVYRIVRDGLDLLDDYNERDEIFMLSNFVAVLATPDRPL